MTASNATRPARKSSARSLGVKLLAASAVTLAMAGCKTTDDPTRVAGWTLIDASQRHPILVSQEPTTHLIRIGARRAWAIVFAARPTRELRQSLPGDRCRQ